MKKTRKKTRKAPSAKQLAARRKFAAAAKARSKAAKKRNGTVIKAKRIEHLDVSKIHSLGAVPNPAKTARAKARKNPALEILREAKPAKRGNQQGWLLGKEFIARGKGTKKLPGGALFDTNAGFVYRRVENPKKKATKRRNAAEYSPETPIEVTRHYRSGGPGYETRRQRVIRLGQRDLFAPEASIDELMGYLRKSNPSVIAAVKRKMGAKAFAKASPSVLKREMKAVIRTEIAKRKTVKKALKGKRRNPNDAAKAGYESFQGKTSTKSTALNFPNGTPANVYKLGSLHSITLADGRTIKPAGKAVWLCADTKGKLHLGTTGERLTNAPKGSLGKVKEVEYITSKPHLGDSKPARYFHQLGEETGEKPTLYSDGNGGLVFKGGAYSITSRGIVN